MVSPRCWLLYHILFYVMVLDRRNLIVEFLHLLWDYIYCCYMMVLNFLPLRLSCKESSTFLTKPLFPQEREDVTALRCSEPLRSKVGGPSKVFAMLCGMGPPGDNLLMGPPGGKVYNLQFIINSLLFRVNSL